MELKFLHSLAHDYCRFAQLSDPQCDGAQCIIWHSAERAVVVEYDDGQAELAIVVPTAIRHGQCDADQLLALLTDGYLGQGLGGAAIGVEDATQAVVLWRRIPVFGLTFDSLARYIQRTVDAADRLENS